MRRTKRKRRTMKKQTKKKYQLPNYLKFIFTKTVIKHVPAIQTKLLKYDKDALSKISKNENMRAIYAIDHLDDPHLSLHSLKKKNPYFSFYLKSDPNGLKPHIRCSHVQCNAKQVKKVNGIPFWKWLQREICKYTSPELKRTINVPRLINTVFEVANYSEVRSIELTDGSFVPKNELKKLPAILPIHSESIYTTQYLDTFYLRIRQFICYDKNKEVTDLFTIRKKMKTISEELKKHRKKHIIIDIRGNEGGLTEVAYPLIDGIFGKSVEKYIQSKKKLIAIDYYEKTYEYIQDRNEYFDEKSLKCLFKGKLTILMNYSSYSMSIIFMSWLYFLHKKFKFDMKTIGTSMQYQRGLSNKDISYYVSPNLKMRCPSRYVLKHGFKDTNVIFTPDIFYMNEVTEDSNINSERDIPWHLI